MGESIKIGKFQILGTLGSGAHSTILHIRRSADSKQYALKVVPITGSEDHKFLEQAQHEFRVAQMLDHPNLIHIYALETPRNWLFRIRKAHLLIEYVNGRTLDKIQYSTPGEKHFEKPIPADWLVTDVESTISINIDKLYIAPQDGEKFGFILSRIGFSR